MKKKIASVIALFSSLSVFCVGFASWNIGINHIESTINGKIIVEPVKQLIDVGISYNLTKYPVVNFKYSQKTNVETNEIINEFSQTNLTFTITPLKTIFNKLKYDDQSAYYLEFQCYYIYPKQDTIDLFTTTEWIMAPSILKVQSLTLENVFFSVDANTTKAEYDENNYIYTLKSYIPIKSSQENSLYQIVSADIKATESVPITLTYEFQNPSTLLTTTDFEAFKTIELNYLLGVYSK